MRWKKIRNWTLGVIAIAGLLMLVWTGIVQWRIYAVQNSQFDGHGGTAIVLGAALWNDEPSPALKERLNRVLDLYEAGKIERVIVSGGVGGRDSTLSEAEGMKRYLTEHGVPSSAIIEETEATSTYENLLFSKFILDENGWTNAVIVTHEYHGARALDIAAFLGMDDVSVSLVQSTVMWMPWHKARETLAFAKWELDKLLIRLKLKP